MKTIETKLFSYKELSQEAKAKVLQKHSENADLYFEQQEMLASMKAICEAANVRLYDWSFGSYCRNWKAKIQGNAEDLEGNRAVAWFLRILINAGYDRPKKFKDMRFPGVCGFTGNCYDDDFAQEIYDRLIEGNTVAKAFDFMADRACGICEKELEYKQSKECILDYLNQDEEIYTEDGSEF